MDDRSHNCWEMMIIISSNGLEIKVKDKEKKVNFGIKWPYKGWHAVKPTNQPTNNWYFQLTNHRKIKI